MANTDLSQGFPYQFGVKVPTKSFAGAPEVVLKAMAQLTYYGKQAVELSQRTVMNNVNNDFASVKGSDIMEPWTPYNEQLILGYMEDDSISVGHILLSSRENYADFYLSGTTTGKRNFQERSLLSAWAPQQKCTCE